MADVLDTVAKFISSPPAQLAGGAAAAGMVWKFSGVIESLLTEQSKFEIAVWLVSVEPAKKAAKLRELLLRYFKPSTVSGTDYLSVTFCSPLQSGCFRLLRHELFGLDQV
jgi:hypothetical protein